MITDKDREKLAYIAGALLAVPWLAGMPQRQAAEAGAIPGLARESFSRVYSDVAAKLQKLADGVIAGKIGPDQFAFRMEEILKPAYERVSLLGKYGAGRVRNLSEADMAEVNAQWESEKAFLESLKANLKAGVVSDARLKQRVAMYGHALREVYNRSWAHHKDSPVYKWHMHEGAEHCAACVAASGSGGENLPAGVYRIDELPFYPGRSPVCLDNCMCWLEATDGDVGAPQIREPAKSGETSR